MMKLAEDLKIGDVLKTTWRGYPSTIMEFKEYDGPHDFILKIAIFVDGSGMSLEKGHLYEVIN